MGKQRFKVGDWVRRVQPSDWPEQYGVVGGIYKVLKVGSYGIAVTAGAGDADATSFEPWQPRVGERVKVNYGHGWNGEGEVTRYVGESAVVLMETGNFSGQVGGFNVSHLEPITEAAAPDKPATLKIEAGRFYKTRDGRKVGPMVRWSYSVEHPWEQQGGSSVFTKGGDIWRDDGTSEYDVPPLVAEWIDEPVAKPSNDNAQPRFKVGDRVVLTADNPQSPSFGVKGAIGKIGSIKGKSARVAFETGPHAGDFWYVPISVLAAYYAPAVKNTSTIVALIENGQPKPSSTPHVHASTGAAEKEAKRLSAKYKGKQFGVFTLTTTHEEAEPVYDHKWQNMAALGLKIDAIKELRAVAGLDLASAKSAVEAWIEYEQAA